MTAKEFLLAIPEKANQEDLTGVETLFHFDIDGEEISIKVENGTMEVFERYEGDAKCVIQSTNDNFMGVVNGDINPTMAVLTGKLKIDNPSELIKHAKSFGLL